MAIFSTRSGIGRVDVELRDTGNRWHPMVAKSRVHLERGKRKTWIDEVTNCDADELSPPRRHTPCNVAGSFVTPVDGGTTSRAEVIGIPRRDSRVAGDTIHFETVEALRFAATCDNLFFKELPMDLKDATRSFLAEVAVTHHNVQWFALHGHLETATGALRCSRSHTPPCMPCPRCGDTRIYSNLSHGTHPRWASQTSRISIPGVGSSPRANTTPRGVVYSNSNSNSR
jgi:hypothetical protein